MPGSEIGPRKGRARMRRSVSGNSLLQGVPSVHSEPSLSKNSGAASSMVNFRAGSETVGRRTRRLTKRKSLAPQRRFTQAVPQHVLLTITPKELQRQEIIFELMITEKQYVDDVNMTIQDFLVPIRDQEILDKEQLNSVFGNLEALLPVNTDILAALEDRKRKFGVVIEQVGDIFLDRVNLFKLYAIYCSNQRAVATRIQELYAEIPEFKEFCAVAHKKHTCRGMCLPDFLIAPLQRLCKYPLIFESLLVHTPTTHRDHEKLSAAHAAIKDIVTKVNERTRQVENVEKLTELAKKYDLEAAGVDIVQAERSFVRGGEVKAGWKGKNAVPCDLILFNDLLLLVKTKKGGGTKLMLNAELSQVLLSQTDAEEQHFELVVMRQATVSLYFDTKKDKTSWLGTIRKQRLLVTELPIMEDEQGGRVRMRNNTFAGWISPRSVAKLQKMDEAREAPAVVTASGPEKGSQTHISPELLGKPVKFVRKEEEEEPETAEKKLKLQRMTQVQLTLQNRGSDKEKIRELSQLLEKEIETTCEMRSMLLASVAKPVTTCTKCACDVEAQGDDKTLAESSKPTRTISDGHLLGDRKGKEKDPSFSRSDSAVRKRSGSEKKSKSSMTPRESKEPKESKESRDGLLSPRKSSSQRSVSPRTDSSSEDSEERRSRPKRSTTAPSVHAEKSKGKSSEAEGSVSPRTWATQVWSTEGEGKEEFDGKAALKMAVKMQSKKETESEGHKELESLKAQVTKLKMQLDVAKLEADRAGGLEREKSSQLLAKSMEIVKDNEQLVNQRNDLETLLVEMKSIVENTDDDARGYSLVKEKLVAFQPDSLDSVMTRNRVLSRVRFFEMITKEKEREQAQKHRRRKRANGSSSSSQSSGKKKR